MKITMKFDTIKNYANLFQIGIAKCSAGDLLQRDSLIEQPHYENLTEHADNNNLVINRNNYFLLEGKIKVYWQWANDENILSSDIDFLASLNALNPEDSNATKHTTSNSYEFSYEYTGDVKEWTTRSVMYEPKSSIAGIEALTDNTVILCPFQINEKYKFENIDLGVGESCIATKNATDTYIFFSQECLINNTNPVNQYEFKKLTSESINISNTSSKPCKIIKIF